MMLPLASAAVFYLNPGSLHEVVLADYDQFDRAPDSRGVVRFGNGVAINFRCSSPELDVDSVREIRDSMKSARERCSTQWEAVAAVAANLTDRLSKADSSQPLADSVTVNELYRNGSQYHALCSDYARLLHAALQSANLAARILWMEGHVVVEYFDTELDQWVLMDPHFGLMAISSDQKPLSIAELIYAVERDLPFKWMKIETGCDRKCGDSVQHADAVWYRNILLNGECHCLSADTLQARGRWCQLLLYQTRPQILALRTPFDTSTHSFSKPVRPREICVLWAILVTAFHVGRWIPGTNQVASESDARLSRASVLSDIRLTDSAGQTSIRYRWSRHPRSSSPSEPC